MKKFKHLLRLFLVRALTITYVPNIGVYAQAEGTESTTTQNLPLDKSYRIKTTEGVASNNGYALGMTAPNMVEVPLLMWRKQKTVALIVLRP